MPARRRPVPNHLRALRGKRGLTQIQLAERVGVDGSTISRWEQRVAQIPDQKKTQLARALGVTHIDLMGVSWALGATAREPAPEPEDIVA